MDLDRDGLGAGNFQKQLEDVLDDVPVVVMHCSDKPADEFKRIQNEGDWVRLEIRYNKLLLLQSFPAPILNWYLNPVRKNQSFQRILPPNQVFDANT